MPSIFKAHQKIDNMRSSLPNRDTIRSNVQNVSIQSDNNQEDGIISRIMKSLSSFNLCLRPQIQSRQLTIFLDEYQVISLYHDPYYGQCYTLQSKQSYNNSNNLHKLSLNLNMSIFNNTQHKQQFIQLNSLRHYVALVKQRLYKKQYKQRKQILQQINKYSGSEQNVLSFTIISQLQKQQFIFTIMQLYIAYDFILIDLEKQFQNRIISHKPFTQSQINILMKQVCTGLVALENCNYRSIRMGYIYFCRIGKEIKVAHPKMFNYETNLKTIYKNKDEKGIYLSPEQLILLQKSEVSQQLSIHNELSNSFTFGMIVLSLMNNKYLTEVYDYRTCQIYITKIKEILKNLTSHYSERLITIVEKLTSPKVQERLNLRSLLNILEEKYELTQNVELTLIKDNVNFQMQNQQMKQGYFPLFQQQQEQPRHKNYLYGMIYPKVGRQSEYYHFNQVDPLKIDSEQRPFQSDQAVIANYRYNYTNQNSKYIGESILRSSNISNNNLGLSRLQGMNNAGNIPIRQGKGLYMIRDDQSYIGQWKNNEMHGYGKLYWKNKKIRYEGQFQNGMFHGFGTQYSQQQTPKRQDQIDATFIRLSKGSWLKYQGRFKNDKRQGPGKVYFKAGRWIGNFKNNQPSGHGIWQGSSGRKIKSVWEDGYLTQNVL